MTLVIIVFSIVVLVIIVVSVIGAIKTKSQNKNSLDDISQKILTNISENPKSKQQEDGNFCEYCGSFVPKGKEKCDKCGANIKLKN